MTKRDRFWDQARVMDDDGCWLWSGSVHDGYGTFGGNGAHRFAYEDQVGPIADGLHLDHLCRVRACVNPAHLEPVTAAENNQRRVGAPKAEWDRGGKAWMRWSVQPAEKAALRKAVADLEMAGWEGAHLTLFTRAAVQLAIRDAESKGMKSAVVQEAQKL